MQVLQFLVSLPQKAATHNHTYDVPARQKVSLLMARDKFI
jgi:hypothetical protein